MCYKYKTKLQKAYDAHRRKSKYYGHFDMTISRIPTKGSKPEHFSYSYVCKLGHDLCKHVQKRDQGSTDKLKDKVIKCNAKHLGQSALPKQQDLHQASTAYDKHYHRMVVALRCAVSNRPFVSVEDEYYKLELEHIRHGIRVIFSYTKSNSHTLFRRHNSSIS